MAQFINTRRDATHFIEVYKVDNCLPGETRNSLEPIPIRFLKKILHRSSIWFGCETIAIWKIKPKPLHKIIGNI